MRRYSVTDFSKVGGSRIISEVYRHGLATVTKSDEPVVLMIPLNSKGYNLFKRLAENIVNRAHGQMVIDELSDYDAWMEMIKMLK